MRKLTARWIPKSLSGEQMATRASVCSALLKRFRSIFLLLVTVDETWVNYYETECEGQSRQWVVPGSSRPKKFTTQPSAGNVMATVNWDVWVNGITPTDCSSGLMALEHRWSKCITLGRSG